MPLPKTLPNIYIKYSASIPTRHVHGISKPVLFSSYFLRAFLYCPFRSFGEPITKSKQGKWLLRFEKSIKYINDYCDKSNSQSQVNDIAGKPRYNKYQESTNKSNDYTNNQDIPAHTQPQSGCELRVL